MLEEIAVFVVISILLMYMYGILCVVSSKPLRKSKAKRGRESKVKVKAEKPKSASKDGLCKLPNGKVGMLKNLPKERSYEEVCRFTVDCPYFFKCIGIEKK